jgi:formylmethanofuran dehydrogenase subunit B
MADTPTKPCAPDVATDAAITRAAEILGRSRNAVIAGMATDLAGASAAVALAQRIGGVLDHMEAAAALRDLDVMRTAGWMVTTPLQARARADVVLLVGAGLADVWPDFADRLALAAAPTLVPEWPRQVIRLCPGVGPKPPGHTIDGPASALPAMLGLLRAFVAGRPVAADDAKLRACAATLASAQFGVVVWSASTLDEMSIEMACGLIDDLNARTRFAGLPLAPGGNAAGVVQAAAWATGFPPRTGFARATPEHDPWRFDATRMVETGEADAVLWISALAAEPPAWKRRLPTVALVVAGTRFATPPEVSITVGRPGIDHDAVLYDPDLGALSWHRATAPADAPAVADVLAGITAALPC